MSIGTAGLHHLTAIATRPQANIEFYVRVLGMRLVKRTVNYDDPQTYHFYFGDALGRPGSLLTFFPWPGSGPAARGAAETTAVALRVPPGSLQLWADRLQTHELATHAFERFGTEVLAFTDQDGVQLELVESPIRGSVPFNWPGAPVPSQMAVQALHAATVLAPAIGVTTELLQDLGMRVLGEETDMTAPKGPARRVRLTAGEGLETTHIDLLETAAGHEGRLGAGSIHHLALRVPSEAELLEATELLAERGLHPTKVKNRLYFKSVYFKEPGGAVFELATDTPGFTVDEPADELGLAFRLPEWLESERDFLRGRLPVTASPEYADRFGGPR